MRTALTALALTLLVAVTARGTATEDIFDGASGLPLLGWTAAAWALFALAALGLRRVGSRSAAVLLVAGTLGMAGAGLAGPPNTSTDSARYAWDGIVSNAGISPYAYAPAADALDPLRPAWLFPTPLPAGTKVVCRGARITTTRSVPDGDVLCTALNRPTVPTIYPPVAEAWFAVTRSAVPPTTTWWPMQLGGALLSLGVTGLLVLVLRQHRRDIRWAALWGWCPFVASEAVTNSHVDVLGVLLVVAATLVAGSFRLRDSIAPIVSYAAGPGAAAARREPGGSLVRSVLIGVLVGLAAAVKVVPAIAAPPLARRRPLVVVAAAALTFVAVYVPHLLTAGSAVLGYLPGYLDEQGYESGRGFVIASLLVPGTLATGLSALVVVLVVAAQWWWADPDEPWLAQLAGAGAILLVLSPPYPWYALVLVPFIALTRRWEWFVIPLVMSAHLLVPAVAVSRTTTLVAAGLVLAGWLWRRRSRPLPHLEGQPA